MKIGCILMGTGILAGAFVRAGEVPKTTPYSNPNGDYESIFRLMRPPRLAIRGFAGSPAMEVFFVPSAPSYAPGPFQPALAAHSLSPKTRWLQIVTIDCPAPQHEGSGDRLFGRERPWSLVDTPAGQRREGSPFYPPTHDGDFIDNPVYWGDDIATNRRSWVAQLFLVRVDGTSVQAIAGLEWGFAFDALGVLMPKSLRVLGPSDWEVYRRELAKEYPAWQFPERR
jgi:hypothetical protein